MISALLTQSLTATRQTLDRNNRVTATQTIGPVKVRIEDYSGLPLKSEKGEEWLPSYTIFAGAGAGLRQGDKVTIDGRAITLRRVNAMRMPGGAHHLEIYA